MATEGRKERSLDMMPVLREVIFEMWEMCKKVQESLSSMTTPRNLVECTLLIGTWLMLILASLMADLDLEKIIYFVFWELRESLFVLNQEEILTSSLFSSSSKVGKSE